VNLELEPELVELLKNKNRITLIFIPLKNGSHKIKEAVLDQELQFSGAQRTNPITVSLRKPTNFVNNLNNLEEAISLF